MCQIRSLARKPLDWTCGDILPRLIVMSDPSSPEPKVPGFDGRRWHDMGGELAGPVPQDEHDFSLWEKRVDALLVLCSGAGLMNVHGLRRALEDMGPEAFESMSYYERWIAAVNQNMLEAGVYKLDELAAKMEAVAARADTYGDASNG